MDIIISGLLCICLVAMLVLIYIIRIDYIDSIMRIDKNYSRILQILQEWQKTTL
jgi:hypothetical protein